MAVFSGSDYQQNLLHVHENMIFVSDAEMILRAVLFCRGIMRWDSRRELIVDIHTFPTADSA